MRFKQVQKFIWTKKYFGVRCTLNIFSKEIISETTNVENKCLKSYETLVTLGDEILLCLHDFSGFSSSHGKLFLVLFSGNIYILSFKK